MGETLTETEIRVLGSLTEKEMATPEHCPLSLNALTNACNQKSNRDPVVSYDEAMVIRAIDSLKAKKFVLQSDAGRVAKYSQNFARIKDLTNEEAALICLLLLRGPQTPGELRGRSDRLHRFNSLDEVEEVLSNLIELDLTVKLPKRLGRKEVRYTHLLAGIPAMEESKSEGAEPEAGAGSTGQDRIADLENQVASLREELEDVRREFHDFKNMFE